MSITMTTKPHRTAWQWLMVAAQLATAGVGAVSSYDFGLQIGGLPLALLLAANGAFFGAISVSFLADMAARVWSRRKPDMTRS